MLKFWKSKEEGKLDTRCEDLTKKVEDLTDERIKLKERVEDLKLAKKVSEEDIKHMTKMKEERLQIELEKKVMEAEKAKDKAIAAVKDEYRTKLEQNLVEQKDDILKMYSQILERLPDINARLRIDQKE